MLSSILALAPEIALTILAAIILVYGRQPVGERRRQVGLVSAMGLTLIFFLTLGLWLFAGIPSPTTPTLMWGGMFRNDDVTLVFRLMFIATAVVTSLIATDVRRLQHGEFFGLIMLATVGFNMMASAADVMQLYLALETASIAFYILAGFATNSRRSPEAGIKYFVYGAFASSVMLYGLSLLYGFTAQTNIAAIARIVIEQPTNPWIMLASVMVLVGFGFKISAVPFHFWAPDVYEGAPTPVTAILSTASKAAGFAVLFRLFLSGALDLPDVENWWAIIVSMSIATMTLGNFAAIWQTNIKRMLAYSSIAQAGYLLIGLAAFTAEGAGAVLFYLLMYAATNVAAFGVIILVSNVTGSDQVSDLSGLSRRSPWLALVMLLALLSLGGIPPTAGFFAKFFLFKAAVDVGLWWLAAIGIFNAFVALYYYLNVAKYIYLYQPEDEATIPVSGAAGLALGLTTIAILYLGIIPNAFYEWTSEAARAFFS
jgi:NADH-quinone oxidoreductase subunit N